MTIVCVVARIPVTVMPSTKHMLPSLTPIPTGSNWPALPPVNRPHPAPSLKINPQLLWSAPPPVTYLCQSPVPRWALSCSGQHIFHTFYIHIFYIYITCLFYIFSSLSPRCSPILGCLFSWLGQQVLLPPPPLSPLPQPPTVSPELDPQLQAPGSWLITRP